LPEPLRTVVSRLKGNHDFGTSNLLQQLLAREINEGSYQEHLRAHARYRMKARAMIKELKQHFPTSSRWQEPRGGLYIWVRLPRSVETGVKSKLFQRAMARDVLYVPGELCYANDATRRRPNHEMRLSFASASLREIRTGIARLGEVLHELMKERP
jgi:2-aminoadipate transaminase